MKRVVFVALALCAECAPAPPGQILLYVDTDAPLPASSSDERALFDTLVVDAMGPDGKVCTNCSRVFALEAMRLKNCAASFGVPGTPGVAGYRVRLRLYDSRATLTGSVPEPSAGLAPPSVIDVTFAMPPVPQHGALERTAFLPTELVGIPTSAETTAGPPLASRVGSWPKADRTPCAKAPRADEICVPGGAFWMGNPRVRGTSRQNGGDIRRLVVLSPFLMARKEVTVPQYRALDDRVVWWSGNLTGSDRADFCTFTSSPGPNEDKPVNCIRWERAADYCHAQGGDLPTEAQFEWVASAFGKNLFVWGDNDAPACDEATLGRAGWGLFKGLLAPCKPSSPPGGPMPTGSGSLDRLTLGDEAIVDLAGNLSEWTRDTWNRQTEACWSAGGVYFDPFCADVGLDGNQRTFRGGNWSGTASNAPAAARYYVLSGPQEDIGFRCVRDASP